ncbi:MAG: hypothetical protein HYW86_03355 [Candidatus Roizmanbacteria bacterium]|nr:MAG: hypothetical protein HYW86_03355 [Candidatus Roizmanbacteria bacterium]
MITIICGEDTVASRNYFQELKNKYSQKGFEIKDIASKDIPEAIKSDQTVSLFSSKIIFFIANLNSFLSKSANKELLETFEDLAKSKDVEIVDWEEDKGLRDIKIARLGKLKEFKPQKNIFQLLDALCPGNKTKFIELLNTVSEKSEDLFIFTMLARHTRSLILAHIGEFTSKIQLWQKGKLVSQTRRWQIEKLLAFYEGLFRIDLSTKTSSNVYGIKHSIEILACYYL